MKRAVFLGDEEILKPSHPANLHEFRPMPTTPRAMRHFENEEGRFLGRRRDSQTVSSREHARVPSHVHHAQSHETLWERRQERRSKALSKCLIFSNRLTLPGIGESSPCPRHFVIPSAARNPKSSSHQNSPPTQFSLLSAFFGLSASSVPSAVNPLTPSPVGGRGLG